MKVGNATGHPQSRQTKTANPTVSVSSMTMTTTRTTRIESRSVACSRDLSMGEQLEGPNKFASMLPLLRERHRLASRGLAGAGGVDALLNANHGEAA